jgi:dihydropyrimidinase
LSDLVLSGGTLVLEDRVETGDLVVRNGCTVEIRTNGGDAVDPRPQNRAGMNPAPTDGVDGFVDCRGAYVLPGLIDLHVHLDDRIGAFDLADTWESGSAAALPTGVTTLAAFATQAPDASVAAAVDAQLARARGRSRCDFALHHTPTRWDDTAWADLGRLAARGLRSVKLYTTYAAAGLLAGDEIVERALARAADLDLTVLLHCEDDRLLRAAAAGIADWSAAAAWAASRPPEAELRAVERAISMCRRTGGRLHVVHVSTPEAALLIRAAATAGAPVTCESCPQYLALDASRLAGPEGHLWICAPPLRAPAIRTELLALAKTGAFDVLATDHCAFSRVDKETGAGRDVRTTPGGLAGLGALAPLGRELLLGDAPDGPALLRFARMLAATPARLLGLAGKKGALRVGADADLVVARLDGEPSPIRSTLADAHEPYRGWLSRWRAERVYLRGALAARDGALVPGRPSGAEAWT